MTRALLVALACVLFPAAAAGQAEDTRGRPEIKDIEMMGNRTFSTDSLKRAIVNRETECRTIFLKPLCAFVVNFAADRHYFRAEEFPRDAIRLRLYYWQRGYREAEADTASRVPGPGEIELELRITEGRPTLVDSIAVVSGEDVADPSLLRDLPLRKGDPLNGIRVEETRNTLESRLHDAGYAYALVLLRMDLPTGSYSAQVTFDVDPGPLARFGPIDIHGNLEISDEVVRRMLGFEEGDLYGTSKILEAQRNLFSLEIVQYARVDTIATVELDPIVPVRVDITEGNEYRVRAGAGWSMADCLSTEARWTARNLLGGARRLVVRGRVSNMLAESLQQPFCPEAGVGDYGRLNWLMGADFTQPWLFSPRNSLSLGIYGERTSVPNVFVRTAVGVNAVLIRSLSRRTSLSMTYRPQLSRLEAAEVFFCTTFLACAPSDIDIIQAANWLAPVGANLSTDATDNLLNPRSGYRASLDLEEASSWTGSNYSYSRALGEVTLYRGAAGGTVAGRLRLGWVNPGEFEGLRSDGTSVVHPQKRFFAGGSNSVRGFAQNRLGPKVLTVSVQRLLLDSVAGHPICSLPEMVTLSCDASAVDPGNFTPQPTGGTRLIEGNLDYRFPITRDFFEGVAFVDFGQVWGEHREPTLGSLAWTPGLGIRYHSVIGPVRLDLGYRSVGGERLQVVTSQVQSCVPTGRSGDRCTPLPGGGGFARSGELALLQPRVPFDDDLSFLQRLQLHFSIGQAF